MPLPNINGLDSIPVKIPGGVFHSPKLPLTSPERIGAYPTYTYLFVLCSLLASFPPLLLYSDTYHLSMYEYRNNKLKCVGAAAGSVHVAPLGILAISKIYSRP
jgi:hypothetical protein